MRIPRSKKGMTLLELLLSFAVSAIILVAMTSVLVFGYNIYNNTVDANDSNNLTVLNMTNIRNQIINADTIAVYSSDPGTLSSGQTMLFSDAGCLQIKTDDGTVTPYLQGYNKRLTCWITYQVAGDNKLKITCDIRKGGATGEQILLTSTVLEINNMGDNVAGGGLIDDATDLDASGNPLPAKYLVYTLPDD